MFRRIYKRGNEYCYDTDKSGIVSIKGTAVLGGPVEPVMSKFGQTRGRVKLLKSPSMMKNLLGVNGDYGTSAYNREPTMGCDPEFFITDARGELVPAFDVLADKKTNPNIFWDGFQAEIVTESHGCLVRMQQDLKARVSLVKQALSVVRPGAQIGIGDVTKVSSATMSRVSDAHAALGCDPSHNLYGMSGDIPNDARSLKYRFAGGHIHFGDPALARDHEYAARVVLNLDKVLGLWSVGVAANYETTKIRRKYYGLAGEFRLPSHGLEYRTLSNFWFMSPILYNVTFELARVVMRATSYGLLDFWVGDQQTIIDTINNYDVETARKLLKLNEKLFLSLFAASNSKWDVPFYQRAKSARAGVFNSPDLRSNPEKVAKEALLLGLEGMERAVGTVKEINVALQWENNQTWMNYASSKA